MTAEQGGVPMEEDVPCAARAMSELVTLLAHENDIPFQDVSVDTVNVNPDELYAECDACDGVVYFRGGIEADKCLSVRSGLKSCIRSWITLHPEVNEDGLLMSPNIECIAENGRYVCLTQFLLMIAEDGTVTTTNDRGMCLIDLEGINFKKYGWSPIADAPLDIGFMAWPEDESGEVIYRGRAPVAEEDAEGIGSDQLGIEVEAIEAEAEDNGEG